MERTLTIEAKALDLRVKATPAERLAELFDAHHVRLYRLARRLSRDAEEARDLVQETFLRAARSPASIPSGPSAGPWLNRVLVNLCRDRWRRLKVRRTASPPPAWSLASPDDPESATVARSVVQDALGRLRPRTRAVVVMHEIEGLDARNISKQLGISEVTVRWHVATGRGQLRRLLDRRLLDKRTVKPTEVVDDEA